MHRYITLLLFVGLAFWGCEDEPDDFQISQVPSTFTKKVLIEEFTGTWCGYCPYGASALQSLIDENEGNIIGVGVHYQDPLAINQGNFLDSLYINETFPSGMVDRVPYQDDVTTGYWIWNNIAQSQLSAGTFCGLALKSVVNGNSATTEVHIAFNDSLLDGSISDYRLTVYLIEDGLLFDQRNYDNSVTDSPYFGLGDPIANYEHNYVLRETLSDPLGDQLSTLVLTSENERIKSYEVDISSYNKNKLSIVAFVNYVGLSSIEHGVMNVQKCDIDGFQDWD